jgi:hypothetical protein
METHGASPFGKDLGLIHEVVVTGRGLGADVPFWADLAHDRVLFESIIGIHRGTHQISPILLPLNEELAPNEAAKIWKEILPEGSRINHVDSSAPEAALPDLDLSKIVLLDVGTYREVVITTHERIRRLSSATTNKRLGAETFFALWQNKHLIPAYWKNHTWEKETWRILNASPFLTLCFDATIWWVPSPGIGVKECVLGLRNNTGEWKPHILPLSELSSAHNLSVMYNPSK